ncbi:hypothetical protein [Yersinia massiliensis]|uniref:hypothetical protein n=1 Tax=Yersinia massiliensis TaxID=419257 RepID=UPI0016437409|nr:hypothetical protein [Yersinia massiliensis]
MNNFEELVYNAMQSSLEGYAASVVDSIEFELKRELTTEEYQQVYVAVDRAITGIAVAQKELQDLRAQLEAAQKLAQHYLDQRNAAEQVSAAALRDWAKEGQRAETAEAALSAANEKLKGEQVPVGFTSERALAEVYCGESSRFGPLDDVGDIPLYDRPQKPVVLSSSTVMSRAYVVQAIEAAGFTVEGE